MNRANEVVDEVISRVSKHIEDRGIFGKQEPSRVKRILLTQSLWFYSEPLTKKSPPLIEAYLRFKSDGITIATVQVADLCQRRGVFTYFVEQLYASIPAGFVLRIENAFEHMQRWTTKGIPGHWYCEDRDPHHDFAKSYTLTKVEVSNE